MAGRTMHRAVLLATVAHSVAIVIQPPVERGNRTSESRTLENRTSGNRTSEPYRQTLANYEDLQYYGTIQVGGQKLHGVFDTGSIELVVISDRCDYWCGAQDDLYHGKQSLTYKHGGLSISISYGSGDLRGGEAYDTVAIGPFQASNTPFWEVSDATMPVLMNSDFEAIIGLGPIAPDVELMQPGTPKNTHSYAVALSKLDLHRYSVCLMKDPGMPGYLTWNENIHFLKPKLFTELAITEASYWMVKLEDVRLGDGLRFCEGGCGAIIDSGTSLLAMPDKAYTQMTHFIHTLGSHCGNMMELPLLKFKLNGVEHTLPPDSYLGKVHGHVPSALVGHFEKHTSKCQATLMRIHMSSVLGTTWILGMPFFRSYYTVFDQGGGRKPALHIAKADDECRPLESELGLALTGRRAARRIDASKLRLPPWAKGKDTSSGGLVRQVLMSLPPLRHGRRPHAVSS